MTGDQRFRGKRLATHKLNKFVSLVIHTIASGELHGEALISDQFDERLRFVGEEFGKRTGGSFGDEKVVTENDASGRHARIEKLQAFQCACIKIHIQMDE